MNSINNFQNMMEVLGRNFQDLQAKLSAIPYPANILKIEREPTGKYYAVVQLDRPAAPAMGIEKQEKPKRGRPPKAESELS